MACMRQYYYKYFHRFSEIEREKNKIVYVIWWTIPLIHCLKLDYGIELCDLNDMNTWNGVYDWKIASIKRKAYQTFEIVSFNFNISTYSLTLQIVLPQHFKQRRIISFAYRIRLKRNRFFISSSFYHAFYAIRFDLRASMFFFVPYFFVCIHSSLTLLIFNSQLKLLNGLENELVTKYDQAFYLNK